MKLNKHGLTLLTLIIWIVIIASIVIFAPKIYNYYVTGNTESIIKSNIESVENEIKSQLIEQHPILIWNNIDDTINNLKIQNPVSKTSQKKNGFEVPGAVVVYFNGVNTFTIDGINPDGKHMNINRIIKQ